MSQLPANDDANNQPNASSSWSLVNYALFDATHQLFESLHLEWMTFTSRAQTVDTLYSKFWWRSLIELQSLYSENRSHQLPGFPITELFERLLEKLKEDLVVFNYEEEQGTRPESDAQRAIRLEGLALAYRRLIEAQIYLEPTISAEEAHEHFVAWQKDYPEARHLWQRESWKALRSVVFYYTLQKKWPDACRLMGRFLDSISHCEMFHLPDGSEEPIEQWTQEIFVCLPPLAEGLVEAGELDALWQMVSSLELLMHRTERWSKLPTHPLQLCKHRLNVALLDLLVQARAESSLVRRLIDTLVEQLSPLAEDQLTYAQLLLQVYRLGSQAEPCGYDLVWSARERWAREALHVLTQWQWDADICEQALGFLAEVLTHVEMAERPELLNELVDGLMPLMYTHAGNEPLLKLWSTWMEAALRWVGYHENVTLLLEMTDQLEAAVAHTPQAPYLWSATQSYVLACLYGLVEVTSQGASVKPESAEGSAKPMSEKWWQYTTHPESSLAKEPLPRANAWQTLWNGWSVEQRKTVIRERVRQCMDRCGQKLEATGAWAELLMVDCMRDDQFATSRMAWTQLYHLWLEHAHDPRITRALTTVASRETTAYGWESYPTQRAEALISVLGVKPDCEATWQGLTEHLNEGMDNPEYLPFVEALAKKLEGLENHLPDRVTPFYLLIKGYVTYIQLQKALSESHWMDAEELVSELRWLWLSLPKVESHASLRLAEIASQACFRIMVAAFGKHWTLGYPQLEDEWLQDLYELYPNNPVISLISSKALVYRLSAMLLGEQVPESTNLMGQLEKRVLPWMALEGPIGQSFAETLGLGWGTHLRALVAQGEEELAHQVLARCMTVASEYEAGWPNMSLPLSLALLGGARLSPAVTRRLFCKADLLLTTLHALSLVDTSDLSIILQAKALLHMGWMLETGKAYPKNWQTRLLTPAKALVNQCSAWRNPEAATLLKQWQPIQRQLHDLLAELEQPMTEALTIDQRLTVMDHGMAQAPDFSLMFDLMAKQWLLTQAFDPAELLLENEGVTPEEAVTWPSGLPRNKQIFWLLGQQSRSKTSEKEASPGRLQGS